MPRNELVAPSCTPYTVASSSLTEGGLGGLRVARAPRVFETEAILRKDRMKQWSSMVPCAQDPCWMLGGRRATAYISSKMTVTLAKRR